MCLRRAEVESLPLEEDIHRLLLEHTQAAGIEGRSSESNSLVWLWPALRRALRAWGAAALDQHPPLLLALRLFFQCLVHTGGCLQGSQLTLSPELATDSPAVLQEILAFTKDLLYRLCWLDRSSLKVFLPDRPPHVLALLEDAKEAFNALFQRHSRLKLLRDAARSPFRDEDFLFPPLPKEDITPEVVLGLGLEAEDEGGHFVGGGGAPCGWRGRGRGWRGRRQRHSGQQCHARGAAAQRWGAPSCGKGPPHSQLLSPDRAICDAREPVPQPGSHAQHHARVWAGGGTDSRAEDAHCGGCL